MKYRLGDFTVKHWNDWDRVPRDPVTVGSFILNALGATTLAASTVASFVVGYIAITAVTSWALKALAPKPSFGSASERGLLVNTRGATNPQQIVYGEIRKGGTVTYIESTGATNAYLHQIICLAGHEVHEIGDIYINDQVVTLDSDGFVTDARWKDGDGGKKILIKKFTGADDQDIYSTLSNDLALGQVPYPPPKWQVDGADPTNNEDLNFKGEGIACLYVRFLFNSDVFAEGVPLITAKVKGKKVYDPRTATTGYSANAALCIRDYLVSAYGLDNSGDTNDTSFSAAANACDETVSLAGSGSENRYEINGVIDLDQSPSDALGDMMTACAGTLFWGQGEWHLKVGEYTSPIKTFTLDDLRSPISLDTKHSRRDNFNIVRGTFVDADQDFVRADYPEIRSSTFITDDNGVENAIDLALPLTTSASMAQRLAKMTLFRAREQMTFTADFSLEAFEVECGDIIALTIDRYGWTAKEFEVVGWKFKNDGDAGDLRVALTLRETSSAAFDWNAEESDITGNDSTLPDPTASLSIASLTTAGGGRTTSDGTFINSVIVSWTAPDNSFITHYDVEWKPTADSNYAATTTTETSIELSPLVDGVEYTIRVRSVTSNGRRGPFVTATFTGGGDTTAPALPTNISASGGFKYITISWTNPTDTDLNYIEIYENTTNSSSGATKVGISAGNTFTRTNLGLNELKYYFLKSVDYSGNASAFTSGVSATTAFLDDADFENGVRQLFIDGGVDIIEPVSSLPASGDYTNQQVFLTTDSKLYYWDGSAWQTVVAETSIAAGSITATEIANDAITTPKIAANAVTASEILGGTITGNKISANTITGGLLATSGIITSAAQIGDGLIQNAKIANAAITTAKIGDNQVTFPQFSTSSGVSYLSVSSGTETTVASITVNQTGAPAYIQGDAFITHSDGSVVASNKYVQFDFRIKKNGTPIGSGILNCLVGGTNSPSFVANGQSTSTGSTTYTLTVKPRGGNDTYVAVLGASLFYVELKK